MRKMLIGHISNAGYSMCIFFFFLFHVHFSILYTFALFFKLSVGPKSTNIWVDASTHTRKPPSRQDCNVKLCRVWYQTGKYIHLRGILSFIRLICVYLKNVWKYKSMSGIHKKTHICWICYSIKIIGIVFFSVLACANRQITL